MPFLIITILITIHELGHFLTAKYYNFDIDKIYLYPYGGISKFNLEMNVSLKKELIVLIMGPIFQIICYNIIILIPFFSNYHEIIKSIHYTILVFNLLPIYPLDGGKLLNIIINYFFSFKFSLRLVILISYLVVISLSLYFFKISLNLNIIFMICFLLYKIGEERKNIRIYYDKFLLERYLKNYNFKKYKKINSIDKFYRDKKHIIKINNNLYSEKEYLNKKYRRYF